jgi:hypothetical protein
MANRIQIRRDSEDNWDRINPTLADGELGLNYDNNQIKVGDGNSNWSSLPYITPTLANVATSGDYDDLSGKPSIPEQLIDLVSSYGPNNDLQFLRFSSADSSIEFSSDFRVVPHSDVEYPDGTFGQDKVGDVAFDKDGIYYCFREPNSYSVHNGSGQGYNPVGWIRIDDMYGKPDSLRPVVGTKLTDGTYSSTVAEIVSGWGQYGMVVRVDPAIQTWHDTASILTVYTGSAPNAGPNWTRLANEIVSAPSTLTSNGTAGQMAYDSNYIYRCITSNVTEVSSVYTTPHSYNGGSNQNAGASMVNVLDAGGVPAPLVGWIISDGSSTRTITNVVRQNSAWGYIYTLTFSGGDINWSTLDSITIISIPYTSGQWVRASWFSGSYNDLDDKPTINPAEPAFTVKTTDFNATAGSRYGFDTTAGVVTATLPASPATGDAIYFADASGTTSTNNFIIARNSQTIMGSASNMTVNVNDQSFGLFYNGTTWRVY